MPAQKPKDASNAHPPLQFLMRSQLIAGRYNRPRGSAMIHVMEPSPTVTI